jgi:hypothetical protein
MNALTLPTEIAADFTAFNYSADTMLDKASTLFVKIDGEVKLLSQRYCRPAVTVDGKNYKEISYAQRREILEKAETVVGWTNLGGFASWQYSKLK